MSATGCTRREALRSIGLTGAALALSPRTALGQQQEQRPRRPNIIFIMADDLGYADLSCFGSKTVRTPHLDALAADGKRFTQFYAASAVCSPTRASVLTGRYPLRFDVRKHFTDHEEHLPRGTVALPKLLKQAGYATAHVGKWHLGGLNQKHIDDRAHSIPGPCEQGFEHYLTQLEDPPIRRPLGKNRRLYRDGGKHLVRNDRNAPPTDKHWTDVGGDEAIALVERYHRQRRPFFINLWFTVPHTPYEPAPEPHLGRYKGAARGDQLLFRSMVSHMDAKIGQLVDRLKALGIYQDTLIIFTSDNGPAWEGNPGPWKGGKTDLHEGGIRVPMIAVWPGRIPAGTTSGTLAHTNDVLPTCCAAAGVPLPKDLKIDGTSLLAHLTRGEPVRNRGTVFWQLDLYPRIQRRMPKPEPYATEIARRGNWKLLAKGGKPVELFDLTADPGETTSVLAQHPKLAAELAGELQAWLAEPRRGWTSAP